MFCAMLNTQQFSSRPHLLVAVGKKHVLFSVSRYLIIFPFKNMKSGVVMTGNWYVCYDYQGHPKDILKFPEYVTT
jgi:hypothetical protein